MAEADPKLLPVSGLRPHRFTVADVLAMVTAGVLEEDARLELIDGQLFEMNPKHHPHEALKSQLVRWLVQSTDTALRVGIEQTLYLDNQNYFEPDILVAPRLIRTDRLKGPDVLLLIEIADSSHVRDLQVKAPRYAEHGVRDYWVVDVVAHKTILHRQPSPTGYAEITEHSADAALIPLLLDISPVIMTWED
jgi:Uma2 family endonuclease